MYCSRKYTSGNHQSDWLLSEEEQLAHVTFSQCETINICLLALKVITVPVLIYIQNKFLSFIQSPPWTVSTSIFLIRFIYLFICSSDDCTTATMTSYVLCFAFTSWNAGLTFCLLFHTINTSVCSECAACWTFMASKSFKLLFSTLFKCEIASGAFSLKFIGQ